MTQAPDFVEALAGYRAWQINDDGVLRAVAFTGVAWDSGVNQATCRIKSHKAPVAGCSCGFHAFHSAETPELREDSTYALGGIGAWGEIDIFRKGFRAEFATVVALAYVESLTTIQHYRRLELAAIRYGVDLVDIADLRNETLKYARPLPAGELPVVSAQNPAKPRKSKGRTPQTAQNWLQPQGPPRKTAIGTAATPAPAPWAESAPGFCLGAHLLVRPASGSATVFPTPAYVAAVGEVKSVRFCAPVADVAARDVIAVVETEKGRFAVAAPAAGKLTAVNEKLARQPGRLGAGEWLARIQASGAGFSGMVLWGEDGWRSYRRYLSTREDGTVRRELAVEANGPLEGSPSELRERLRARRQSGALPSFLTEPGQLEWLAETLDRELAEDAPLRDTLRSEGLGLVIEIDDLDQRVVVESGSHPRPQVRLGGDLGERCVRLRLDAHALHSFWTGELDLARLTREQAAVEGARRDALRVTALVRRLCPKYSEHARVVLEARRQAWRAVSGAGRWWEAAAA